MALRAQYYKLTLNFRFDAGTSRGVLKKKDSYFLKLYEETQEQCYGIGEFSALEGLSLDFGNKGILELQNLVNKINTSEYDLNNIIEILPDPAYFPAVCFALECAILDLKNKGIREIFSNDFYSKNKKIKINGLVWMGKKEFMRRQIREKINDGFDTIKLKIAAINFEDEIDLIKEIRKEFKSSEISIRVDANGGFSTNEALEKLKILSEFDIHSIEQPIMAGNLEQMAILCQKSPIPIVLDEEIIKNFNNQELLLSQIKPAYIILKPSLMGGIAGTNKWISTAENLNINWWITSALESNIGLNAICQLCAEYANPLAQGLGTGKLYENNINSPLKVERGYIHYDSTENWNLEIFN